MARNLTQLPSRERSQTLSLRSGSPRNGVDADMNGYMTPASSPNRNAESQQPSAVEVVGQEVRSLVSTINHLQRLGIENIGQLPLPKIVVVGDQSAGKSSLVEAISEIKVPRSSGTCTRCPLQITLQPTPADLPQAQWSCSISILNKYFKVADSESRFDQGFLGPWSRMGVPESVPFINNCSKADLASALNQAQHAVLNPSVNPNFFAEGNTLSGEAQCPFSPNVVLLDISGPGLPNLSFTDLPGVINQSADQSEVDLPKLVKHLVRSYIEEKSTLVLLACSLETDIANSAAAKIVRSSKAEDRAIGVLTKPDRLPQGSSLKELQDVLQGRNYKLGHGYYVTRQSSQVELDDGIDHRKARSRESEFFSQNHPWNSAFDSFKNRFGTQQLQEKLSKLLAKQILQQLPDITKHINKKYEDVTEELANLPEPPAQDSLRIAIELLAQMKQGVKVAIQGEYPHHTFKAEWRAEAKAYRQNMVGMKPVLVIKSSEEAHRQALIPKPISVDSDDEGQTPAPTTTRKRPIKSEPVTPSKKQKGRHINSDAEQSAPFTGYRRRFNFESIGELIRNMDSDIPNLPQPKVVEILIKHSITNWDKPLESLFNSAISLLTDKVMAILESCLLRWMTTEFTRVIRATADTLLKSYSGRLHEKLLELLQYEQSPLTLNEIALESEQQKELRLFETARLDFRKGLFIDEQEAMTGKFTEGQERIKKLGKLGLDDIGPDPFSPEVAVMSRVRGYYNVAAMRLVDHVYQVVQFELFERCSTDLPSALENAVAVHAPDAFNNCVRLLTEDQGRERKRTELRKELEKLTQAKQHLQEVYKKHDC